MTRPQQTLIDAWRRKGANKDLSYEEMDGGAVRVRLRWPAILVTLDAKGRVVEDRPYPLGEELTVGESMTEVAKRDRAVFD